MGIFNFLKPKSIPEKLEEQDKGCRRQWIKKRNAAENHWESAGDAAAPSSREADFILFITAGCAIQNIKVNER